MTYNDLKSKTIGVLMGGLSAEREISLKSGAAVAGALRSRGYRVAEIDVDRNLPNVLTREGVDTAVLAESPVECVDGDVDFFAGKECREVPVNINFRHTVAPCPKRSRHGGAALQGDFPFSGEPAHQDAYFSGFQIVTSHTTPFNLQITTFAPQRREERKAKRK